MGRVEGKVALVTGAARGQGRSHAVRLAKEGADIIAVDICRDIETTPYPLARPDDLAETVRQVEILGRRIVAKPADVRDRDALESVLADGLAALGRLDIVVANAGIAPLGPQGSVAAYGDAITVNLGGFLNTVVAAMPHLPDGASIIATGSIAALINGGTDNPAAGPGGAGYTFSKRSIALAVEDLARILAPSGIRVNAVHPFNVNSDMMHNQGIYKLFRPDLESPTWEDVEGTMSMSTPMGVPYVEPEDISDAVIFLASDESRFVTGLQLKVDAGSLLMADSFHQGGRAHA
jgi:SDR family mycofactocin-dependent oxidoreductase